jgi:hypothetical protein
MNDVLNKHLSDSALHAKPSQHLKLTPWTMTCRPVGPGHLEIERFPSAIEHSFCFSELKSAF